MIYPGKFDKNWKCANGSRDIIAPDNDKFDKNWKSAKGSRDIIAPDNVPFLQPKSTIIFLICHENLYIG